MFIYKTTNLINNKIYIGKQKYNYKEYLGSGKVLNLAIDKYGKENFKKEILEECNNIEELNEREKYWIKKLNSQNRKIGYNIADGGTGGKTWNPKGIKLKEETKQKISNTLKNKYKSGILSLSKENHPMFGKNLSESHKNKISNSLLNHDVSLETKNKISKTRTGIKFSIEHKENLKKNHIGMLGKHHSDESRKKMSISRTGIKFSIERNINISNKLKEIFKNKENHPMFGKYHSDESKKKMSISHIGKYHSEESKKKMSDSFKNSDRCKGINNPMYGKMWINKDNINKVIKSEELEYYLKNKWNIGRIIKKIKIL